MSREADERAIAAEQRNSEAKMLEEDWSVRMVASFAGIARRVQARGDKRSSPDGSADSNEREQFLDAGSAQLRRSSRGIRGGSKGSRLPLARPAKRHPGDQSEATFRAPIRRSRGTGDAQPSGLRGVAFRPLACRACGVNDQLQAPSP